MDLSGGSAAASSAAISSGSGTVSSSANATGGAGGSRGFEGPGQAGGAGGDASASSTAKTTGSGGVSSSAFARGGSSGTSIGSSAGAARSATASSAALSSGSGGANSTATAVGGEAGDSFVNFGVGDGVSGGEADATSIATSNGSGSASSAASASGGDGGSSWMADARRGRYRVRKQHGDGRQVPEEHHRPRTLPEARAASIRFTGAGGDGGNATAMANASAAGGGTAIANAVATGGVGSVFSPAERRSATHAQTAKARWRKRSTASDRTEGQSPRAVSRQVSPAVAQAAAPRRPTRSRRAAWVEPSSIRARRLRLLDRPPRQGLFRDPDRWRARCRRRPLGAARRGVRRRNRGGQLRH